MLCQFGCDSLISPFIFVETNQLAIGNAVGKYIDRSEIKENIHACAIICVEVYLGKGLPEPVKIKVNSWVHIQQLDYEQIPFKCKVCHEYYHFSNICPKKQENDKVEVQDPKWEQVKKKMQTNLLLSPLHSLKMPLKNPLSQPLFSELPFHPPLLFFPLSFLPLPLPTF